ncbi:uncharacterized protein B0P05DRAFT_565785 [Gilbertella persicaria]|uniref:uncharacterized protein n=1 Tax=Gilbertella persicaria TaxID=101096 RepID=UPI00221F51CF|nr:uncharacterized protein B0P05DRAFT_565785 [Gilbertella persicaria]KAI8047516.1 hypothetical protein B0P05DRAFT_565785 [Gilbertella persicaria]
MIKNLGKFKQWTGERFGGAKVTLQTEDFQQLEQETENRRDGYDNVVNSVELVQSYLLKKKTSPEDAKNKMMPFEVLGTCLYHYGTVFPDDSALGIALINLGQAETRIAALQEAFAHDIKTGYMTILTNGLQEYKEYDSLRKKLASRRLDYDSKLNRLNKAKKEKPELEQEMQAARIKYEETEHDLIQKMAYMQEFENEHRDALLGLIEAQCTYHTQAKELLEAIKKTWGQGSNSDPHELMNNVMARASAVSHLSAIDAPLPQPPSQQRASIVSSAEEMARDNSIDTFSSGSAHQAKDAIIPDHASVSSSSALTPPSKQFSEEYEKHRKALFDFTGQNDDEISFKTGDIIAVVNEIDKGWWLGEINAKRGIFPVNYTEDYIKAPVTIEPSFTVDQDDIDQHQLSNPRVAHHNETPIQNDPLSLESPAAPPLHTTSSIRRPPPPPTTASSPAVTTSRTSSLSRNRSKRAPPPPPPLRVATSEPHYIKPTSVDDSNIEQMITHHACPECECHDYIENLFKKGYCNHCFHKHL